MSMVLNYSPTAALPNTESRRGRGHVAVAGVARRGSHGRCAGAAQGTMLKRQPTLAEVAEAAAFLASDRAGAMTGKGRQPDL